MIVGGGRLPDGLMEEFVLRAGGQEQARLVYVPCSEAETVEASRGMVPTWQAMGVKHAVQFHTKDRLQAHRDEQFLAPLRKATGIWFGGGRQWNFADSYYGTTAHRLMKEVLQRGGVIGGSSAGASIQASYLARATPIGNQQILAPGYERGGLGFIRGVAIDQHFTQRRRQPDLSGLIDRYPQLLGIGIDETTALVVQSSVGKVQGEGHVYFYDRQHPRDPEVPEYLRLGNGEFYDLAQRRRIEGP
jgi:cyanophycinase